MTAKDISNALARRWFDYRANVCVPNCHFAGAEADLLVLRPSGWLEEVEIKISVADFRREFMTKEDKHRSLKLGSATMKHCGIWHMNPATFDAANPNHIPCSWYGGKEPDNLRSKVASFWDYDDIKPSVIRRFWFAVPVELLSKIESEIPEYAGILVCETDRWSIKVSAHRVAPARTPSRKLTMEEQVKLMRLAYLRYWGAARAGTFPEEIAA